MTLQNPGDFDFDTGLDDFDMEDAVIPRLTIVHKEGRFKDSLSNEEFDSVRVIFLGLVKQRTLWHFTVDEGDWPMCRSANHEIGFPNLSDEQPKEKRFPWEKSGFSPADYPPDEDGKIRLPCDRCQLKEWKSHPDGKKPYCAEQFTMPVLYDPHGDDFWVPAIMTFQKTSLKGLKSYLTSFKRNKAPAFEAVTEITLTIQRKGSNDYSVPNFKRVGDTESDNWREYSTNFRTIRDFLTEEPATEDDGVVGEVPASSSQPAATKQEVKEEEIHDAEIVEEPEVKKEEPAKSEPKAEAPPASPAADDDDDLPF